MILLKSINPITPFPRVPASIRERYPDYNLSIRAFGLYKQDLDVDFDTLQPYTITKILQCCTSDNNDKPVDESFFWNLSIGKRLECLLAIISLSGIEDPFFEIRCLNSKCQKQMEVDISIEELARQQHITDDVDRVVVDISGHNMALRKPNGIDQLELLKKKSEDTTEMTKHIIEKLLVDKEEGIQNELSEMTQETLDSLDKTMSEFDPLINLRTPIICPYCESEHIYVIELEEYALKKLQAVQQQLIRFIHTLAKSYHWSEHEILSIPIWRRAYYVSLIEKEEKKL